MLKPFLTKCWRIMSGDVQWHLLWILHAKFNVGVSGIIKDNEGKILLLRHVFRRDHDWGLPSGWIKRGETFQQALVREIKEEVGIDCEVDEIITIESGYKLRIEVLLIGRIVNCSKITKISTEIYEAGFYNHYDLPNNTLPKHVEYINNFYNT